MSVLLDAILAQATNGQEITVTLSPESVAVLLFGTGFIDQRKNWLDQSENPLDEVTDTDWDTIEKLVGNLVYEVFNPVALAIVGEVRFFALETLPSGWMLCDGRELEPEEYPELFDAISYLWGGLGGGAPFNIPDMQGRSPMGYGIPSGMGQSMGFGAYYGEQEHQLTGQELPVHSHGGVVVAGSQSPARAVVSSGGAQAVNMSGSTANYGTDEAHNTIHPVTVGQFAIYTGVA